MSKFVKLKLAIFFDKFLIEFKLLIGGMCSSDLLLDTSSGMDIWIGLNWKLSVNSLVGSVISFECLLVDYKICE
jgi:hypothetical protein